MYEAELKALYNEYCHYKSTNMLITQNDFKIFKSNRPLINDVSTYYIQFKLPYIDNKMFIITFYICLTFFQNLYINK
jgi:hypothetical protein